MHQKAGRGYVGIESTGDIMIVEVILIHNSNVKKEERKKRKNDAAPNSMQGEVWVSPPPHPLHPCSLSAPRDLLGRQRIRISEAMSTLKIRKAGTRIF